MRPHAFALLGLVSACAVGPGPGSDPYVPSDSYVPTLTPVGPDSLPKADEGEVDRVTSAVDDDGTTTITYSSLQGWERITLPFAGVAIQATPRAAVDAIIDAADGRLISRLKIVGHGDRGTQDFTIDTELRDVGVIPLLVDELSRLTPHFAPGADVELQGCLVGSGYGGALLLDDLAYIWRERSVAVIAGTNIQRALVPVWIGHVHARRYIDGRGTWWDDFGDAESVRRWYFADREVWHIRYGITPPDPLTELTELTATARIAATWSSVASARHDALMAGLAATHGEVGAARAAALGRALIDLLAAVTPDERYYFFADLFASRSPFTAARDETDTWRFLTGGMPPDLVPSIERLVVEAELTRGSDGANLRGACPSLGCLIDPD